MLVTVLVGNLFGFTTPCILYRGRLHVTHHNLLSLFLSYNKWICCCARHLYSHM